MGYIWQWSDFNSAGPKRIKKKKKTLKGDLRQKRCLNYFLLSMVTTYMWVWDKRVSTVFHKTTFCIYYNKLALKCVEIEKFQLYFLVSMETTYVNLRKKSFNYISWNYLLHKFALKWVDIEST